MLISFVLTGAGGAGAYVVLSSLLHRAGMPAWAASLLSYAVFIPVVYLVQRRVTFRSTAAHGEAFPKYVATQLIGLGLSALLPWLSAGNTSLDATLAFALVACTIAATNFALLKLWAFRDKAGAIR